MSSEKITYRGTIVWFVCALFFTYEFLLRTVLGTFQLSIVHDLSLTPLSFAILSSSAYQLIYGLMQIPVSTIVERFGLKFSMFFACLICAFCLSFFALSSHFITALVFRVLTGLGASFGFICLLVAVYEWMPQSKIAFFIGVSQFVGTLGPMTAAGPLEYLTHHNHLSWRSVHFVLSGIGVVLALLIFVLVKNKKVFVGKFQVLKKPDSTIKSIFQVFKNTQVLAIALFSAFSFFSIEFLSENAGKQFLVLSGHSQGFASNMISLSWLCYAIGCPLLGIISDLSQKRRGAMIASAIASLVSVVSITYFAHSRLLMIMAFSLLGLGASGQSIGFVIIVEQLTARYTALALGFNNAAIGLFTAINSPFIGLLLYCQAGDNPGVIDYQYGFLVLIGIAIGGLLLSVLTIKETFCKSRADLHVLTP